MELKRKIYNLLRWSEKYTKTDMLYIAKGGFWLTLGRFITFVASFLLTIVFANLLPKETFGTYKYVLSLAGILAIPTLSGMNTAVLQAVARGYEGSFLPALKTKLRWGTLSSIASIILAGYYFFRGDTILTLSFLIVAVFLPLMNSFLIYESFWLGKKRFDVRAKYNIATQVLAISSMIATLFLTKNLFVILLVYFISWTSLRFIFLKITLKKSRPNKQQDPKTIPYGKHLSLMNVTGIINAQLEKILLWHFLGAGSLAVYSIALTLPDKIKDSLSVISGLAFPKFSQRSEDELKKSVPKKMLKIFLFVLPITIVYIFLAPYVYKIFFPKYPESIIYSQVYVLLLLVFPRTLLGTALTAKMRTKALYSTTFILAPTRIVLLFTLVPLFGIWGVITAFLIMEVMTFGLAWFLLKRM